MHKPSNANHVAIVGLSCRTAGGNDTPEKLWNFIINQQDASGEVPHHRWEPWRLRDPRNGEILDNIIRKGYFLDNLECFDAAFFGISPKEAELMDPHQRLALELAWEALENAGIDPKSLAGSDTAVFIGVDSDDYSRMLIEDLPNIEAWSGIGSAAHGIPNRISYHLDLQGPSTAVDAACASSLIAIHLARQAIVSGESTVAICGGVNVICAPGLTHMLQKAGALSSEGVCRSFDDDACGYARGEGGAIIILKRFDAAIADGDNILAVLKGSASAQDGKTNGIMAPNAVAQEKVARYALQNAGGLDPLTISYVEAHATSTALGDPTELRALANVYGEGRLRSKPCYIGSIKPNVGHLEAAAGAIGFVKAVLSVQKGQLAPQTRLRKLNTRIDWESCGLDVVRGGIVWPSPPDDVSTPRRAAVCCYGYGGSVCHAIIEQSPVTKQHIPQSESIGSRSGSVMLVLSAHQEKRLAGHAGLLADWLSVDGKTENLYDVARTLSQRRAAHDYRAAFVVRGHDDAVCALRDFCSTGRANQCSVTNRKISGNKDIVFVYSGHGAQWPNMGRDLVHDRVFRSAIMEVESVIQREAGFSALEALEEGDFCGSHKIQVLTYVMQYGLTAVLKSKGLKPGAIIGHSVGEIAANVTAGCLSPAEGAVLVTRRAKLYAQVQGLGGMGLVSRSFESVANELGDREDLVAAIDSSPSTCVVSGGTAALEKYLKIAKERGIKTWKIETDVAFHSPVLESLIEPFKQALNNALGPQTATTVIYATSGPNPRSEVLRGVEYWVENMVGPVRLKDAVNTALDDGYRLFMEVSSHPIITHSIAETICTRSMDDAAACGTLHRNHPADHSIMHTIARLFTLGADVDFRAQQEAHTWSTRVPNTPWVHKPFWKSMSEPSIPRSKSHNINEHNLLGRMTRIAGSDVKIWSTVLDETTKPYPLTHPLDGTEIIPAAVYCATFQQATGATVLTDLVLKTPTPISHEAREVQVVSQGDEVRLFSRLRGSEAVEVVENSWIEHSTSKARSIDMASCLHARIFSQLKSRIDEALPNNFAWDYLQQIGVGGIAFPWAVLEHYRNEQEMLVRVDMDPKTQTLTWSERSWAPFLDAATSIGSSIFYRNIRLRIVRGIDELVFISDANPPKTGWLHIVDTSQGGELSANISILDDEGSSLIEAKGMQFVDVEATHDKSGGADSLIHRLAWIPAHFSETPLALSEVVVVSTNEMIAVKLRSILNLSKRNITRIESSQELLSPTAKTILDRRGSIVMYFPAEVEALDKVPEAAHAYTWETAKILQLLAGYASKPRLFVISNRQHALTELAQSPLRGFSRVAASEYFDTWGGFIDCEDNELPLLALKYVRNQAIIRIHDGLPRIPRMRPFAKDQHRSGTDRDLLPNSTGTYLITGGFGDLGLEVLDFLVEKGARRLVVVSRKPLPPRKAWGQATGNTAVVVARIEKLESMGVTFYAIPLDIGSPTAPVELRSHLDRLNLPPILGVVHAAGISLNGSIKDTTSELFSDVMVSKIQGTMNLHKIFPPGSLDFMVLFSSIGQLLGTPGQAAYASANAFLDAIATNRRSQGCNSVAIQWTAWRNMGLARDNDILEMELSSQGVTDITVDDAFLAWEHISKLDTDHAVVTRTRILDADETLPSELITEIVQRRAPSTPALTMGPSSPDSFSPSINTPQSGPELEAHLRSTIRLCLSNVLHLDVDEIDDQAQLTSLGVDSVMTVALRQQLQRDTGVKVPPTLTWNYPTVKHLSGWFYDKMAH